MATSVSMRWDLDSIFSGGSSSKELQTFVEQLENEIKALNVNIEEERFPADGKELDAWVKNYLQLQHITAQLAEARAFVNALLSDDITDTDAKTWQARLKAVSTEIGAIASELDAVFEKLPDDLWQALLKDERLQGLTFPLEERRQRAIERMEPDKEQLAESLAQDGYHGWSDMYNALVSQIQIPVTEGGQTEYLSVGQAQNKAGSHDRSVRIAASEAMDKAWKKHEDLFAETLNHLSGFRLNWYKKRGWNDVLKEPLMINRMQKETLEAMWEAVEDAKSTLLPFMDKKAEMMGLEALEWHDVSAPLAKHDTTVPFEKAADQIVSQFREVSPKLADFAAKAFENRWIEAENRNGKRPGGFCTTFPISDETRIFMTYSGTPSNVQTLAHELGHAYHQHAMKGLPYAATRYAMNVAETASTFAEQIVADAAVAEAETAEEKIALLDTKISRGLAFFMNLHARFIFEKRFYEKRKEGWANASTLNEWMVEAQKEAYCNKLASYNPRFWASKLHFHMTPVPFYNFPYTFGYLFSMAVYERAKQEGTAFEERYIALLRDTASMTVEDLAEKHLGEDITQKAFWQRATEPLLQDVEKFMELSK
ncbi:M3 family oligoendopeptidase [Salsuginibacillus kocurii]|uniref:M3 family oligoendopeptidase n=1 Tax=Salsuginibacillus kocurii TaxID=427078 RepID=UPI00037F6869|nr:M3 family oligoendopeptidase [Salsuginibacillus kocurii]